MVSREVYSRHVYILRILWVLSSFPRSERETRLLVDFTTRPLYVFVPALPSRRLPLHVVAPVLPARLLLVDFAARPPHVFVLALPSRRLPLYVVAPVLPARLLLVDFAALPEATALDAQNPSPVVTIFRGYEFVSN